MKHVILLFFIAQSIVIKAQSLDWAKQLSGNEQESGRSILVDDSGYIYTVGAFQGTVDFDPGTGTTFLSSNGLFDNFIQKMDPNGNFLWAKSFGGTGNEIALSLVMDQNNNIYISGFFQSTVDFDPNVGTTSVNAQGIVDQFILKLDSNGNFIWVKSTGGTNGRVNTNQLHFDMNGNLYAIGDFEGNIDFDPNAGNYYMTSSGLNDVFIQKLDLNGNFIWAKQIGGALEDWGYSIVTDNNGNICVTGAFRGNTDFDPGSGTNILTTNPSYYDIYILKLDNNGNFIWVQQFGGNSSDVGFSIDVDSNNNYYIAGYFADSVDFDNGTNNNTLYSLGNANGFLLKINSQGDYEWVRHFAGSNYIYSRDLFIDDNNNVFLTGTFSNNIELQPENYTYTSSGSYDLFLSKISQQGYTEWMTSIGGTAHELVYSIALDNFDNLYLTGSFNGLMDANPGAGVYNLTSNSSEDIFILKINSSFSNLMELNQTDKVLVRIVDLLGRETAFKPNTPLIFIYEDGSTEKVMRLQD